MTPILTEHAKCILCYNVSNTLKSITFNNVWAWILIKFKEIYFNSNNNIQYFPRWKFILENRHCFPLTSLLAKDSKNDFSGKLLNMSLLICSNILKLSTELLTSVTYYYVFNSPEVIKHQEFSSLLVTLPRASKWLFICKEPMGNLYQNLQSSGFLFTVLRQY